MASLGHSLSQLAGNLSALLSTRAQLFSLEALDARDRLLGRLALLLGAAIFLLLALLVATAAFALYVWPDAHRYWALGLLALLYALIGAVLVAVLISRMRRDPAPFSVLADVLRQDAHVLAGNGHAASRGGSGGAPNASTAIQPVDYPLRGDAP